MLCKLSDLGDRKISAILVVGNGEISVVLEPIPIHLPLSFGLTAFRFEGKASDAVKIVKDYKRDKKSLESSLKEHSDKLKPFP